MTEHELVTAQTIETPQTLSENPSPRNFQLRRFARIATTATIAYSSTEFLDNLSVGGWAGSIVAKTIGTGVFIAGFYEIGRQSNEIGKVWNQQPQITPQCPENKDQVELPFDVTPGIVAA